MLLETLVALTQIVVLFWLSLMICLVAYHRSFRIFFTSFKPWKLNMKKSRRKRIEREKQEIITIMKDLEEEVQIAGLMNKESERESIDKLLELGIALNHTLSQQDNDGELPGDHWISGYRWVWFIVYQILVGYPIALVIALPFGELAGASIGFLVSLASGIFFGTLIVPEKSRAAIPRFGGHRSFLDTGLNFRVPMVESGNEVNLKNMVWGPGREVERSSTEGAIEYESDVEEYHLKGSTGDKMNPEPGVFIVALHGTYNLRVTIKVTLRVRRSDRHAWYWWNYEYANRTEVGEAISDIAHAVLSTKAREIDQKTPHLEKNMRETMSLRLRKFLDEIPEITGKILLTLYEVSRERLAGLLPISVAITSVDPPKEFTDLLLRLDSAQVHREEEALAGQGRGDRWTNAARSIAALVGKSPDENLSLEMVQQTIKDDMLLEAAKQPSLDAWLKTKVLPGIGELLKTPESKEPKKKKGDET